MPDGRITKSAFKTHGKNKDVLRKLQAEKFTKDACEQLVNFLNDHEDLPIVAHNVEYDRDKVLKKAFSKVNSPSILPPDDRWLCTFEMADVMLDLDSKTLDDLLEHFGFERREEDAHHEAIQDCELTAKKYMELMKTKKPKVSSLGFCKQQA